MGLEEDRQIRDQLEAYLLYRFDEVSLNKINEDNLISYIDPNKPQNKHKKDKKSIKMSKIQRHKLLLEIRLRSKKIQLKNRLNFKRKRSDEEIKEKANDFLLNQYQCDSGI